MLCAFIVHCHKQRNMQVSTIKSYLSGIQLHLRCSDPSVGSLMSHPSVRLLLNGIKKIQPEIRKDKRLPSTLTLVRKMVSILRMRCFGEFDDLLETVFLTAFYGFLRCGEYAASVKFYPARLNVYLKP